MNVQCWNYSFWNLVIEGTHSSITWSPMLQLITESRICKILCAVDIFLYLEPSCQKSRQIWELQCISSNQGNLIFDKLYLQHLQLYLKIFSILFAVFVIIFAIFVIIFAIAPFAWEIRFSSPLLAVQGWDEVDDFVDYLWRWNWKCVYGLKSPLESDIDSCSHI